MDSRSPLDGLDYFASAFGVDERWCERLLGLALEWGGDYAELFVEERRQRRLRIEEGQIRGAMTGVGRGVGIRVIAGDAIGYASTERFDDEGLGEAARIAAAVAAAGGARFVPVAPPRRLRPADRYPVALAPGDEPAAAGADLLRRADAAARAVAPSVTRVEANLQEEVRRIAVATSEGRFVGDVQPAVRLVVEAVSERGDDRQRGFELRERRAGLDFYAHPDRSPEAVGRLAAERAVRFHDAVEAPAGFLPVVLAAGESGILLHEAVGHGLEADFNWRRLSSFTDRVGERVASPLCTVVDDGTLPGVNGSLNVDDEGQEPRVNMLIENGTLRGYLHDWRSARKMGVAPSGNGRRQDYRWAPMPRMTSTYMLPGESTPEEIVRAVARGIYCVSFSNGQVDIASGDYTFATEEAYLIEDGRITAPIRPTNLIGNGPDSLSRVTMVGHDLVIGDQGGMCGKGWQAVPVSLGMPTTLVDGITVGGTGR